MRERLNRAYDRIGYLEREVERLEKRLNRHSFLLYSMWFIFITLVLFILGDC